MVDALVTWSLQNRFLVVVLSAVLALVGVDAALRLPIDAVPDVTNTQVMILTKAPALGPEEVEQLLTTPIEQAMGGLPDVTELRSTSKFGLSVVTVVFEDATDIYFARQLVNERLIAARELIPTGLGTPELAPVSTGLGEIYQFEVRGAGKDAMELRAILDWEIAPRLRAVAGVVEVNPFGGQLKTYEVQLRPELLAARGVAVTDVFRALASNNANAGGAYIEKNSEQYLVRGEGLITSLDDLGDIVVATSADGTPVFVRQLGEITFAPVVRQGAVTRDGRGEIVSANVMMLLGANSREVVAATKDALETMKPDLAALGVTIDPFYDRTELVDHTIRTVGLSLFEGGVLVIGILFLLLRNLQAGLLVAAIIPLAMLTAFIGMRQFHVSANLMSLGALDFGLIVDGAVIVIENSLRLLAARSHALGRALTRDERTEVVRQASLQVVRSATFGVLIIAIVYAPILTLTGIEGKTFKPMAMTVLFALAGALLLTLTLIPALASVLLPRRATEEESVVIIAVRRVYEPALRGALRFRWLVVAVAVGLLVATGVVASRLGAEFAPRLDEGAFIVEDLRLPSVSLEESVLRNADVERILKTFPEVITVVSKTGRPEIGTDPMSVNQTDVYVMLKPPSAWVTATSREALIEKMNAALTDAIIGETFAWSQPIEMRMSELIAGVRADVAIKIYGDDLGTLDQVGQRIAALVADIPGAADVKAAQGDGLPVLRVQIDRQAIARHGLNADEVLAVIEALGGREVGSVREGRRRFAIQVRFAPGARASLEAIAALQVRTPRGQLVPIGQLATLRVEDGPVEVTHELGRRFSSVRANVRGRDLAGFVADAKQQLAAANLLPPGYFVEWGGQFENLEAASKRLAIVVPVALLLIFVLLYAAQGSASHAALIYLNVPFAITGGVFALAARGMPLSISAGVGFIALFGVAVLNGLVLVSYIQERRRAGVDAPTAAFEAARVRLRPVLMTALVASFGFVPMALNTARAPRSSARWRRS